MESERIMSGFLEQLNERVTSQEARIAALEARIAALGGSQVAVGAAPIGLPSAGTVAAAPIVAAPAPAPAPAAQQIDADALLALIQPHLENDAMKLALGNAMRARGVQALQDATPAMIPMLYADFQQIINGAAPAPVTAAAPTSII